jgi:hypothetical protein
MSNVSFRRPHNVSLETELIEKDMVPSRVVISRRIADNSSSHDIERIAT